MAIVFGYFFIFSNKNGGAFNSKKTKMENLGKIIIFNLILIFCLTAFIKVRADQSANTQLSLAITQGSLSVTAPSSASFAGKSFSFDGQDSLGNSIGQITAEDARGIGTVWGINISATDWTDGEKVMKYNGDGITAGKLSIDVPTLLQVSSTAGEGVDNLTMGTDASFTDSEGGANIKLIGGNGSGRYNIDGLKADQFIPGGQALGSYSTTLTLTIS